VRRRAPKGREHARLPRHLERPILEVTGSIRPGHQRSLAVWRWSIPRYSSRSR
jgi:hypothetical protein